MAAARHGELAALGALLEAGAIVNLSDELGASALHWAVVGGSQEAVLALAQVRAPPPSWPCAAHPAVSGCAGLARGLPPPDAHPSTACSMHASTHAAGHSGGSRGCGPCALNACQLTSAPWRAPPPLLARAQRGAAVDITGTVHEEETHLERPLLTAALRGDLPMLRLLAQVGAAAAALA